MNRNIPGWMLCLGILWPFVVPLLALGGAVLTGIVVSVPLLFAFQLLSFPVTLVGVIERFRALGCTHWIAAAGGLLCLGATMVAAIWFSLPVLGLRYL